MEKKTKKTSKLGIITFLSLSLFLTTLGCSYAKENKKNESLPDLTDIASAIQTDFTVAAEKAINAVVHIKSTINRQSSSYNNGFNDPFFDFFFGERMRPQNPQPQVGMGSGVIISQDGYIVTNNHVIERADKIEVTLNDKRSFTAKLIGVDPVTDIALLKIDAENLATIPYGDSDKLKVGEWVLAVGNPFNLTSTVTAGIVSAKARNINILPGSGGMKIESFIQTDAAVNPGNSGGALVSTNGELVGINTAIASQTGNYTGYSFAVPISIVSKVIADLKEYGAVQRAVLGIIIHDIDAEFAKEKDLSVLEGVYVEKLQEKSSAKDAGMKAGDVITGVNGTKVKSVSELQEQLSRYRPGNKVSITVLRGKKEETFEVTLKNVQGNTDITKDVSMDALGVKFKEVSSDLRHKFGLSYGVQVESVGKGKFQDAGVKPDFIILKINNQRINSDSDINDIAHDLQNAEEQAMFIVGIYPNGKEAYYAVNLN